MGQNTSRCIECHKLKNNDSVDQGSLLGPTCYECLHLRMSDDPADRCSGCNKIKGKQNMKIMCRRHEYRACKECRKNIGRMCTTCLLSWHLGA